MKRTESPAQLCDSRQQQGAGTTSSPHSTSRSPLSCIDNAQLRLEGGLPELKVCDTPTKARSSYSSRSRTDSSTCTTLDSTSTRSSLNNNECNRSVDTSRWNRAAPRQIAQDSPRVKQSRPCSSCSTSTSPAEVYTTTLPASTSTGSAVRVMQAVNVLPDDSLRDDVVLVAVVVCVLCASVCCASLLYSRHVPPCSWSDLLTRTGLTRDARTAARHSRHASAASQSSSDLFRLSEGDVLVHRELQRVLRALVVAPIRLLRGPLKALLLLVRWLLTVAEE